MDGEDEKSQLKWAGENPWYCLATLYGELFFVDREVADKNRTAWN